MFYKLEENGDWSIGNEIHNKDFKLDKNNKIKIDGWEWFDEDPIEYTEWLKIKSIGYENKIKRYS